MVPVGPGGTIDVGAMANQPQIQQLRQMLQQNPALIQPILQELAGQNPQLVQLFAQHPQALAQLFGLDMDNVDLENPDADMGGEEIRIELTEEDRAAIQRVGGTSLVSND